MLNWLNDLSWAVAMRSEFLTPVFKGFSALGYGGFLFLFLPIGYWIFSKDIFARMGLLLLLSALLNAYLKDLFQDPRPDPVFQLDPRIGETYGFPSGHAQMAVVVWFWIAWETRKAWMWTLSILLVSGICLSRLYLGVHDVADVAGGIVIGLASLILFVFLTSKKFDWWHKLNPLWHVLAIAAICFFFFATWPGKLPGEVVGYGVLLVGLWAGVGWERRKLFFARHEDTWRVLLSVLLGVSFFLFLRKGFHQIGIWFESVKMYIGLFQALFLGIYISAIAPWMFQRLHLAKRKKV